MIKLKNIFYIIKKRNRWGNMGEKKKKTKRGDEIKKRRSCPSYGQ
jgi:hypothetical protein